MWTLRIRLDKGSTAGVAMIVACSAVAIVLAGTGYDYRPVEVPSAPPQDARPASGELGRLQAQNAKLRKALARKVPQSSYIVIDQTHNRLYLRRGEKELLSAVCSGGSGMVLRDVGGDRMWTFDTPRGRFQVRRRLENPVWRKPDWAFVEAGEPIPEDPGERIEYGTLGEYALYLEDGYMIHGTLYERLLGRSVTHGCVRLGRDDLRTVWRSTGIGTPVYIF
jgi:L,D-transpeptidase YbiS